MSEKEKRKRRSFWEPESKALKAWLDDQADLGISLQLIIVDAIRKYGDGDVIRAHLRQLENGVEEQMPYTPQPTSTHKVQGGLVQQETTPQANKQAATPPTPPMPSQEEIRREKERLAQVAFQQQANPSVPTNPVGAEDAELDDTPQIPQPTSKQVYDPIAVMMKDIGSTMDS